MSIMNNDSFSTINPQFGNYAIMFIRENKNETKIWICTHKSCNAFDYNRWIDSIVKTSSIKLNGNHEYEHPAKMSLNVYECSNWLFFVPLYKNLFLID